MVLQFVGEYVAAFFSGKPCSKEQGFLVFKQRSAVARIVSLPFFRKSFTFVKGFLFL
jgi:hypothetical protein